MLNTTAENCVKVLQTDSSELQTDAALHELTAAGRDDTVILPVLTISFGRRT